MLEQIDKNVCFTSLFVDKKKEATGCNVASFCILLGSSITSNTYAN